MKTLKNVASILAVLVVINLLACCSSDPNPVDYLNNSKGEKAFVEIGLNVETTRAVEGTAAESGISKVYIYVFDDNGNLEGTPKPYDVSSDNKVVVETTRGVKTIYAVTAKDVISSSSIKDNANFTLSDFESAIINSQMSDLCTINGNTYSDFVMLGKKETGSLVASKSQDNIPNKITISLERLVAKIQVRLVATNIEPNDFGIRDYKDIYFKVYQTASNMSLVKKSTEILSNYVDENPKDGTYDNYVFDDQRDFTSVPYKNFDNKFQYSPENIVDNPVSGNTTFMVVKMMMELLGWYKYENDNFKYSEQMGYSAGFYTIGIYDEDNNFVDFYRKGNDIMYFMWKDDTQKYITEHPASNGLKYEVLEYTNCVAYYRVNITDGDGANKICNIKRNKLYKITINAINELGMPSIADLVPKDPESSLVGGDLGIARVESTLNVADWDDEEQESTLK